MPPVIEKDEKQDLLEKLQALLHTSGDVLPAQLMLGEAAREFLGEETAPTDGKISKSHLAKIAKWAPKEIDPESLRVFPTLMITEEPTRNLVIYTAESQKISYRAWEGIPVLYNATAGGGFLSGGDHSLKANSQFGRIYQADVVKTLKGKVGTLAWWYTVAGISEEVDAFIRKCETGLHREGSIHVTIPLGIGCSICKDAFSKCNENAGTWHYPGEKYAVKGKGKKEEMCYISTLVSPLGPLEYSIVAVPGSTSAHIMPDDEVTDYISIREALGGSREALDTIPRLPVENNNVELTKEQIAEGRKKLIEKAKAASVSLAEFLITDEGKSLIEAASIKPDALDPEFVEQVKAAEIPLVKAETTPENDPPKPPVVKPLFESKDRPCPVCKRKANEGGGVENEDEIRAEYQAAVDGLVTEMKPKLEAAETAIAELPKVTEERDALLDELRENTVTLAIEKGVKKPDERDAYRETLGTLSYQQLKEVRAPLIAMASPAVRETIQEPEQLVETMTSRLRREVGSTAVETNKDGRHHSTITRHAPRFGVK